MAEKEIGFLQRIYHKFRLSFKWVRAIDLTAKSKLEEALKVINEIKYAGRLQLEVDMLKAQVLLRLEDYIESFKLCKSILDRVNKFTIYNENEKLYIISYISWLTNRNIAAIGGAFKELHPFLDLGLENVELNSVASHLKTKFPLQCHPKWVE